MEDIAAEGEETMICPLLKLTVCIKNSQPASTVSLKSLNLRRLVAVYERSLSSKAMEHRRGTPYLTISRRTNLIERNIAYA